MNTENLELKPDDENTKDVLDAKIEDAATPTFQVEVDPEEAETLGAFTEDALSVDDALDSSSDKVD